MKKILLILLVLVVLALALAAAWYFKEGEEAPVPASPIEFPIADPDGTTTTSRSTIAIASQDGQITVNNFSKNADVYEDPVNPGYYYLGHKPPQEGEPDESPFNILYIAESSYFNVVLNREPIGENRKNAEAYLLSTLGISQSDMCRLVYTVSVPNYVNSNYTGTNLGFSFCPDAVPLP